MSRNQCLPRYELALHLTAFWDNTAVCIKGSVHVMYICVACRFVCCDFVSRLSERATNALLRDTTVVVRVATRIRFLNLFIGFIMESHCSVSEIADMQFLALQCQWKFSGSTSPLCRTLLATTQDPTPQIIHQTYSFLMYTAVLS
jgi:hypothetical protein